MMAPARWTTCKANSWEQDGLTTGHKGRILLCDSVCPCKEADGGMESLDVELVLVVSLLDIKRRTFTEIGTPCSGPTTSPVRL